MAAAPVRQRCGTGGPRSQLPPCYFEGYLEKRGPKEKVGPVHHAPRACSRLSGIRACWSSVWDVRVRRRPLATQSGPPFPVSINFLIVLGWARQSERWRCGNSVYHERAKIMAAKP
ncbi:hypothetical protein CHARACLAT_003158 [Characodon lateralis]|uniref:Uncharacterized protein n=1 Tax=Characodon lateralis TaxID=208331 RepID=A0ABU7E9J2_9TELE|nr:hypothetical protein [Characodon lateralis]